MIVKALKNKNYVCIHKGFLEDKKLSFRAKGVMAYCLACSKAPDFEDLLKGTKVGRDSLSSAINELVEAGYILKKFNRQDGKFQNGVYYVYEVPLHKTNSQNESFKDIQ